MGTLVVGYVPRAEGEAALRAGVAEAKLRDATLIVVSSHRGGSDFTKAESQAADEEMERVRSLLADTGVEYEIRHLVRGFEPAEDVISIAEANSAELIIIGLRRRSPVGKLIMGSNAQRVLLDAPCPVLAVKVD